MTDWKIWGWDWKKNNFINYFKWINSNKKEGPDLKGKQIEMLLSKFRGSGVEIKDLCVWVCVCVCVRERERERERETIGAKPENCWPQVSPMKKRAVKMIQTLPWKLVFGHRAMSHASFKECEWTQHAPTNFFNEYFVFIKRLNLHVSQLDNTKKTNM
jgi:hypothetical protein